MNRLPAVLQKEIWEYVHGDHAFWKTRMDLALSHLPRNLQLEFYSAAAHMVYYETTINGKEVCGFDTGDRILFLDDGTQIHEECPGQLFDVWCNVRGNKLPRFGGRIAKIKPIVTIRPPIGRINRK